MDHAFGKRLNDRYIYTHMR